MAQRDNRRFLRFVRRKTKKGLSLGVIETSRLSLILRQGEMARCVLQENASRAFGSIPTRYTILYRVTFKTPEDSSHARRIAAENGPVLYGERHLDILRTEQLLSLDRAHIPYQIVYQSQEH